jgi:ATP-dependent DNA ligase
MFDLLRHGPREKTDVVLYAFLLELDGEDLRRQLLEERERALSSVFGTSCWTSTPGFHMLT